MKTLKFSLPLPDLILSGEKTTTWRYNDDKKFQVGDVISLLANPELNEFAKAEIISVKMTTFGKLDVEDWDGHEKFESETQMKEIYKKYYKIDILPETELKVIKFKII